MPGYLLETMPSIHASIIGFIGAVSCAFGVVVFAKVREFGDARNNIVDTLKMASNINNSDHIEMTEDIVKGGRVDWGSALGVINKIHQGIDDEDKVKYTENLIAVLSRTFNSYPFSESGYYFAACKTKRDSKWWVDFKELIESLVNFKKQYSNSVFDVATYADRKKWNDWLIDNYHVPKECVLGVQKFMEHQWASRVIYYFEKIDSYASVLVEVEKTIEAENRWVEDFNIKRIKKDLTWVFILVMVLGVMAPMVLLQLRIDFDFCINNGWCWKPIYSYMLFFVTIVPYFYLFIRGVKGFGNAVRTVRQKDVSLLSKLMKLFRAG